MPKRWTRMSIVVVAFALGYLMADGPSTVQGQAGAGSSAAVPGAVGALDVTGPYEVVRDWPKDLSTLPGNEKWTWGAGQGVFAENPNRVY